MPTSLRRTLEEEAVETKKEGVENRESEKKSTFILLTVNNVTSCQRSQEEEAAEAEMNKNKKKPRRKSSRASPPSLSAFAAADKKGTYYLYILITYSHFLAYFSLCISLPFSCVFFASSFLLGLFLCVSLGASDSCYRSLML